MAKDKILLFIPMYNCEKQITRVLNQIDERAEKFIDEILIVNNRSTDNGENVVKSYIEESKIKTKITLVRNDENYGLGGSHKVAISYALKNSFEYLIVLHGDDQGKIKDIIPFLESGEYKNYDCLLGSRFMKGSNLVNYSKFRVFGNKVFNGIYNTLAGGGRKKRAKITDLGSGLNLYKVSIFEDGFHLNCRDNLTFNNYLLLMSYNKKLSFKFFPVTWEELDQVSNVKMFKQSFTTLKIVLSYAWSKKKFMKKDHRVNKNFQYTFKVVGTNWKKEQKNGFHLIMPMGGKGSRFSELGFTDPKPLLMLQDKPFFYWATKAISNFQNVIDITFVILKEHIEKFDIENKIKEYYKDAKFVVLDEVLKGAALSCEQGLRYIDDDYPVVFNDCDHTFTSSSFKEFMESGMSSDGAILTFKSDSNKFSYVQYNEKGEIIGTVEKQVVSDDAICGVYCFKNKQTFEHYLKNYLVNCKYSEFFLSGVYNEMCKDNKKILAFKTDKHISFGVPEEYEEAKKVDISKIFEKIGEK